MESTTVDVNGGNAEVARDTPNLQNEEKPTSVSENVIADNTTIAGVKMEDGTEVNGDVKLTRKIKGTPVFIKKLRKFKENSMTVVEADAKNNKKGQKRKLSEPDISSDDSMEFNGFDSQADSNELNGSMVLQKLIAEVEATETTQVKRRRTSMSKDSKSFDYKDDDMLLDEFHDDGVESPVSRMIKTEKESDTDSIGFPMGLENDPSKTDESSVQSVNSSANSSPSGARPKLKVGRNLKSTRPHSANKQKIVVDLGNPLFREPFKYGWKRELVFRAGTDQHTAKARSADIYYYTPKGKKVRSFREVAQFLKTKELTIDNFTFFKEPLGLNDPDHEIIRDARVRESLAAAAAPTPPKKVVPAKKAPAKKIIEKPQTPPTKPPQKSPKAAPVPFKIKLPAKKAPIKKEIKSPPKEPEMLPPQWSSPASTRRSQAVVEKTSPPAKPKRILKAKLQEPCSIRCLSSMGLIPSLQCSLCLCLYHPECVGEPEVTDGEDYICKNCHEDSGESSQSGAPPPPPLIPISMLGVQKAIKPRIVVPPKLQKIKKVEVAERKEAEGVERKKRKTKVAKTPSLSPGNERNDTNWLQTGNDEFLRGHDGTMPKPAQNIALMAGKRYIVVPKNNAMAVQPAITVRPDKIGDKAPSMQETSHREFLAGNANSKASLSNDREKSGETMNTETNEIASTTAKDDETKSIEQKVSSSPDESFENFVDLPMTVKSDSEKKIDEKREKDEAERKEDVEKLVNDLTDETPMSDIVVAEQEVAAKKSEVPVEKLESTAVDKIEDAVEKMELSDEKSEPAEEKSEVAEDSLEDAVEKLESAVEKSEADVEKTEIVEKMEISKSPSLQTEIIPTNNVSVETKNATITSVTLQPAFKKKLAPLETDSRHFMVSVCAGYHALSRIFQYLKVQELLRAARVCKMWRDLAAHPNLWKTVRMKNSQVTDWDGFADSLKRHGTQHLDLRKMLVAGESDGIWKKFVAVVPRVTSLVKLELCRCPVMVVEEVIKSCPQLQVLSAMSIKCDSLNLESAGNLKSCQELRLKAISGMSLHGDLTPLQELTQLTQLSLTSVKELGKKNIAVLSSLVNLETLELGECSDFPDKFGTSVLLNLVKLERLRLEKGQGSCCTFDILEGVSKLETLSQLELVNFDVKNGFDKCLSNCKNIKRLLIIPTYISQSATSNNMVLGGVTELSDNLTHFVWGVTLELLRVTELFVDQCNQMSKTVTGDSIPVLKPVPCLKLIEDVEDDETSKGDEKPQPNLTNPQVDILPLPQLQKLLLTALPKTRVKILKIPFHATWRQNISDTTTQ